MQQQLQSPACINEDSSCWGRWSQGAGLVVTTGLAASDFEKINRPSFFSQTLDADFHQITMVLSHLVQVVFHFAKTKFDRWEPLKRLKFAHPTTRAQRRRRSAAHKGLKLSKRLTNFPLIPQTPKSCNASIEVFKFICGKKQIAFCTYSKGQLISKCLFGAIVSTKKPTKFF